MGVFDGFVTDYSEGLMSTEDVLYEIVFIPSLDIQKMAGVLDIWLKIEFDVLKFNF